jgi:L-alanine-DL-glutamate epimerase-like enolase superfamily enzyme
MDDYLAFGVNAVKIKVGRDDLNDDLDRIKAVREHIGPNSKFMVDANYGMDVDKAVRAIEGFRDQDIMWFEEPIDPDDLDGYKRIADETGFPLAAGENSHSIHDFRLQAETGSFSFLQPDVATCGGITTWLRAAELCEGKGISVCSHGMQELHVSLLAGRENSGWLEVHSFPIDQYTTRPLVIEDHMATAPNTPGIGVTFDWEKLNAAHAGMAR